MARLGGTQAASGYYWNPRKWSITPVPRPGGLLPGGAGDRYVRVPALAVLLLLPVLGGLFVVLFPVIGFGFLAWALARKAAAVLWGGTADLASTVAPGWRPGEAHLTGKGAAADKDLPREHGAGDRALEALRKEIESRREEDAKDES